MSDHPSPAIDPAVIEMLRQLNEAGQPDVVKQVFSLFVTEAPSRLAAIGSAIEAADPRALQRSAHTFKGAAGTIGATALETACRVLEDSGKRESLDEARQQLETLHHEYRRVKDEIDQLL